MSVRVLPRTEKWQGAMQLSPNTEIELIGERFCMYHSASYWAKAEPKTDITELLERVFYDQELFCVTVRHGRGTLTS